MNTIIVVKIVRLESNSTLKTNKRFRAEAFWSQSSGHQTQVKIEIS